MHTKDVGVAIFFVSYFCFCFFAFFFFSPLASLGVRKHESLNHILTYNYRDQASRTLLDFVPCALPGCLVPRAPSTEKPDKQQTVDVVLLSCPAEQYSSPSSR
ncbi:hypothetical protein M440DRAFT_237287 [Trichoderma longibrachiatum ATCC 18648]|uniref:Uncharacterized protein n=1 Tax=Trichoderma longibrachiatum ATCC 18648 TaxID=983965 RepID=A0A2T4CCU2_TRILO|nr:hypothetical protein M440DRAFT_237287 [Trichoderma longibrachiatum ATCC 18648]